MRCFRLPPIEIEPLPAGHGALVARWWPAARRLCGYLMLCPVPFVGEETTPGSSPTSDVAAERGVHQFIWGDFDGDGRLDLAALSAEGTLQLLLNAGEGRFEDVTDRLGLSGIRDAGLALWADYDGDGRLDLFVGAREGRSWLFHNEGALFVDMSEGSGLVADGQVLGAYWLDFDGDARLDLNLFTAASNRVYRGLEGGFFESIELPLTAGPGGGGPASVALGPGRSGGQPDLDRRPGTKAETGQPVDRGEHPVFPSRAPSRSGRTVINGPIPGPAGTLPIMATPDVLCASSVEDLGLPGDCLQASSMPTLGLLYPLSTNLFVATSGEVGIGTTSPSAKLEVAGTVRVTDTLTLAPSGNIALNLVDGSIYKEGSLFITTEGDGNLSLGQQALTTYGGAYNTAIGQEALNHVSGSYNTATGFRALRSTTSGSHNTANGTYALSTNTYGYDNTACGSEALQYNTTGASNTAHGSRALAINTYGSGNTAIGDKSLSSNTSGFFNTAIGDKALFYNSTASYNTAVGHSALASNYTGGNNTAAGSQALESNTTGYGNTACGVLSLTANTVGNDNTGIGNNALAFNRFGLRNTANGAQSLYRNDTGTNNTANGFQALRSNTSGSRNIALGYRAGDALTTGDDNIAIGSRGLAGESASIRIGTPGAHTRAFIAGIQGVTTGSADAIPVLIDSSGQLGTVSDQFNVHATDKFNVYAEGGARVFATGTVSPSLVVDDAGKVGIGTANPAEELDVLGTVRATGFQMPTGASANRVLTSDAAGNGSWQPAAGVGGTGTVNSIPKFTGAGTIGNSVVVESAGNIGIGTTPTSKLDVAGTTRIRENSPLYRGLEIENLHASGGERIDFLDGVNGGVAAIQVVNPSNQMTIFNNRPAGSVALTASGSLTGDLVVDDVGQVGIGTNTPAAKLDVAGTARMRNTLTLSPTGDQALDVSSGSIYKGGALFIHTKGGGTGNTALGLLAMTNVTTSATNNTALGSGALFSNMSGRQNNAIGTSALGNNTTGNFNNALGVAALANNVDGFGNVAIGDGAALGNLSGSSNTAVGRSALVLNTIGVGNVALGFSAGANITGTHNIALGYLAGRYLTAGSDNIAIGNPGVGGEGSTIRLGTAGTQTRTFIAGIHGVTVTGGSTVQINNTGQLGTVTSSRRFKEEIRDMGDSTQRLLELRPVIFRYKPEVQSGERPLEYGLIAEEVAEVFPDLVINDEQGKPFTVKYHLLSSMLLNELKKQAGELEGMRARLDALESQASPEARPAVAR